MSAVTWVGILLGLAGTWFVLPFILKRWQVAELRRCCKQRRLLVLTYDDGPGTRLTESVIALLDSGNAKATFFLIGHQVESLKPTVARIVNEGHELGSHSQRHLHAWKQNPVSVFIDIREGLRSVRSMAECKLFRAPYGKLTLGTLIQAKLSGCTLSWWTIDSTDTWDHPRKVEDIVEQVRCEGGGVILMHDMDRPDPYAHEFVIELTKRLISVAATDGFRICKMGEVVTK
jgi:peptidoglycan/xylan/chitin deacetylase (PgdA/CDA1 family)